MYDADERATCVTCHMELSYLATLVGVRVCTDCACPTCGSRPRGRDGICATCRRAKDELLGATA